MTLPAQAKQRRIFLFFTVCCSVAASQCARDEPQPSPNRARARQHQESRQPRRSVRNVIRTKPARKSSMGAKAPAHPVRPSAKPGLPKVPSTDTIHRGVTRCPHCRGNHPYSSVPGQPPEKFDAIVTTWRLGRYRLVACDHAMGGNPAFSIYRGKRLLARETPGDWRLSVVASPEEASGPKQYRWLRPGSDITGDGESNLVLFTSHTTAWGDIFVYQLGKRFRKFLHGSRRDPFQVVRDVDGDGTPEMVVRTYGGFGTRKWHPLGSASSAQVVLKFVRGRYRIHPQLMRRPLPPAHELAAEARRLRNPAFWPTTFVPKRYTFEKNQSTPFPEIIGRMLTLVFTGNARDARKYLNQVWSPKNKHKTRFLRWFERTLRTCPYWRALRKHKAFSDLSL